VPALQHQRREACAADRQHPQHHQGGDPNGPCDHGGALRGADEPPQHFTFKGERVYHASGESGTLRVHAADGRLLRLMRIPDESYNVQQAGGWVVTPGLGTGTLCVLNARGRILRTEKIARSSHDACVVLTAVR